jgi:uncharacterized membrane protein
MGEGATKIEFRLRMLIMAILITLGFFSWSYDIRLMARSIISFGVLLVARTFVLGARQEAATKEQAD